MLNGCFFNYLRYFDKSFFCCDFKVARNQTIHYFLNYCVWKIELLEID